MSGGWRARRRLGETRPKTTYCGFGWVGVGVTAGAGMVEVDEIGGFTGWAVSAGAAGCVVSAGAGVASEGVGEGPAASGLAAAAACI